MSDYLHIVCLDAPAPPDYGGAIDMFYKIKALASIGKKIILHYFNYNAFRNTSGLENDCENIYAYKRKNLILSLPLTRPFIIQSRINKDLINRLNEDNYPVLLEGLHCSGIIPYLNDSSRVVIRMHNEEASYYHHLAETEKFFLKKKYFQQESKLLNQYQKKMSKDVKLAPLSETDLQSFEKEYGFQQVHFIPCFTPWQRVSIKEGKGSYCLYHGNMTVSENEKAAHWLIQNIFSQIQVPFIIAGKGISKKLEEAAKQYDHIAAINNPSIAEIDLLIQEAHINVLPSMNATGVKLKLLNALLNGRHCITNENGIVGSKIKEGVIVENTAHSWQSAILNLMQKNFNQQDIEQRKRILFLYDNLQNARMLSALW